MLTSVYPKYVLFNFEQIPSTEKKLLTNSKKAFFLKLFFKVGTQVEHRDKKPYANLDVEF